LGRGLRQSFVSRPDLRPPTVTVTPGASQASGDVFLAPYSGSGQYGPMILDGHGGLIWFDPLAPGARASDLRVQSYRGQPVLTWWQDPLAAGGSSAAGGVIADSSYRQVAVVRAGNSYQADLHEFQLTPEGTALITVYDAIRCDLSAIGGPREGAVADTLFQEIDLATGLVRYEWHFLDHVALSSSYYSGRAASLTEPFDAFHINSVDVQRDGSFLVDARNTWAAYDVDPHSGQVRWELGGRHSSFKLGPGVATAWQHDAREQPDGAITVFDNGADPRVHPASRAIEVALDPSNGTATLLRSYSHPTPLVADSQGNLQALGDGDWVIGWGQAGYFSEVEPSGRLAFDAHLPSGWETYRTYVLPWSARPAQAPSLALRPGPHGGVLAYASWNGATGVAAWRVLGGGSPGALAPLVSAPRAGFETSIALPAAAGVRYLAVQALDSQGGVLAGSRALKAPRS
jgi:Arylsulfotransferase (ASST)